MKKQLQIAAMNILIGIATGCLIMWTAHKDSIQHYNVCQEKSLLDSISKLGDEKSWYVKEDSFGKIKLVQLSNNQIDSLSK